MIKKYMVDDTNNILQISWHHITRTLPLENHIKGMLDKLQHKFNHITHIHVILKIDSSVHPHLQQAEAELSLSGKKELVFAKASSFDMYDAIHELTNKLERQIIKHKEIHSNHHNHHNSHHHNNNHLLDNKDDENI